VNIQVATKENPTPGILLLPRTKHESNKEFEERLEVAKSCPASILGRGGHESSANFKTRLQYQAKISKTIMPRSDDEPEKHFVERCRLQQQCDHVVHAYDAKREDHKLYSARLEAQKDKTGVPVEPGDKKKCDVFLKAMEASAADATTAKLPSSAPAPEPAAPTSEPHTEPGAPEPGPDPEPELEPAPVPAQKFGFFPGPVKTAEEPTEPPPVPILEIEKVDINTIGFMALKTMLTDRGVPKSAVTAAPNKFSLKEVAAKYDCKIEFT